MKAEPDTRERTDDRSEDPTARPILEAVDLHKQFGLLWAVDGVSLRFQEGSIHAVIGPNGAGKTTFFNLLSCAFPPTKGSIIFKGADITGSLPHELMSLGLGRSFQTPNLFPELDVLENVRLAVSARRAMRDGGSGHRFLWGEVARQREEARAVLKRVSLDRHVNLSADSLSHGDKRKLELALLLAQDAQVLLLDEPTAGLASEDIPQLMDLIREINAEGRTIVVVEHNMQFVLGLSSVVSVMHYGRVIAQGPPEDIPRNEEVREIYLGRRHK